MSYAEAQYIIDETAGKVEKAAEKLTAGIPPQDMQLFSVTPVDGGAKLKFKEPEDTYIDGQRICSVKGVKIVLKEGSYPLNEDDGTLIVDNTEFGKYENTALVINELTNGTEYYIGAFPYSNDNYYNRAAGLRVLNNTYAQKNRA